MTEQSGRPGWPRRFPPVKKLRDVAETMLLGLLGGAGASALGMPAAWLTGSMFLVSIAAIRGRPMSVPHGIAQGSFVVMGLAIGAVVTPETLRGITTWPLSIAMLLAGMLCIIAGTGYYLRRVHRIDTLTALYASYPGAITQVLALAVHGGVDVRAVALIQTLRVLILSLGIPYVVLLFGVDVTPAAPPGAARHIGSLVEIAALVVLSAGGAWLLRRLRFPGGLVFGAMISSAALYGSGVVSVAVPEWIVIGVMVMTGAIIGARFADTDMKVLGRLFAAAMGSFVVATAIAAVFAVAASLLTSVRMADVVLAFSPGALDVNLLLALALGLDPIYIGAHHVARVTFLSFLLPIFIRAVKRRRRV